MNVNLKSWGIVNIRWKISDIQSHDWLVNKSSLLQTLNFFSFFGWGVTWGGGTNKEHHNEIFKKLIKKHNWAKRVNPPLIFCSIAYGPYPWMGQKQTQLLLILSFPQMGSKLSNSKSFYPNWILNFFLPKLMWKKFAIRGQRFASIIVLSKTGALCINCPECECECGGPKIICFVLFGCFALLCSWLDSLLSMEDNLPKRDRTLTAKKHLN